jgi:hypothetical protein
MASCALFKWPGYLVRDDADARLEAVTGAPGKWFSKIGNLKKKTDEDPLDGDGNTDPFAVNGGQGTTKESVYPIPMTLQNTAGTALDVFVLGKGPDFVRFQRSSDNQLFDLRLTSLSEASLAALAPLPATLRAHDYSPAINVKAPANSPPKEERTSLAEGIRREIERNERELEKQQLLQGSGTMTSSQKNMILRTISQLKGENARLKLKLAEYEENF